MMDFAWLIEAPGARYLGVREFPQYSHEFFWTTDHEQAIRLYSEKQADGVMMAVRRMEPALFAFAVNLGDARPVEHGWLERLPPSDPAPKGRPVLRAMTGGEP